MAIYLGSALRDAKISVPMIFDISVFVILICCCLLFLIKPTQTTSPKP